MNNKEKIIIYINYYKIINLKNKIIIYNNYNKTIIKKSIDRSEFFKFKNIINITYFKIEFQNLNEEGIN